MYVFDLAYSLQSAKESRNSQGCIAVKFFFLSQFLTDHIPSWDSGVPERRHDLIGASLSFHILSSFPKR